MHKPSYDINQHRRIMCTTTNRNRSDSGAGLAPTETGAAATMGKLPDVVRRLRSQNRGQGLAVGVESVCTSLAHGPEG